MNRVKSEQQQLHENKCACPHFVTLYAKCTSKMSRKTEKEGKTERRNGKIYKQLHWIYTICKIHIEMIRFDSFTMQKKHEHSTTTTIIALFTLPVVSHWNIHERFSTADTHTRNSDFHSVYQSHLLHYALQLFFSHKRL